MATSWAILEMSWVTGSVSCFVDNEPHSVRCRVEVPRESQCPKVGPRPGQDFANGFDTCLRNVTDVVACLCHGSLSRHDV